jgi:hypothetical protein
VRSLPQADGARDLTVPNAIAEYPEELHSGCWVTSGNAPRLAPTDKHCRRDRETAPPPTLLRIEHQLLSADRAGHCADTSRTKGVERLFKKRLALFRPRVVRALSGPVGVKQLILVRARSCRRSQRAIDARRAPRRPRAHSPLSS